MGQFASGDAVMPGQCRAVELTCTPPELAGLGDASPILGRATFDIYLDGRAVWRQVEAAVWAYDRVGRESLRKWLSYLELGVLDRVLTPREVDWMEIARHTAAILTMPSSMHRLHSRNYLVGAR